MTWRRSRTREKERRRLLKKNESMKNQFKDEPMENKKKKKSRIQTRIEDEVRTE